MSGRVATSATADSLFPTVLSLDSLRGILEGLDAPAMVADRGGQLFAANSAARRELGIGQHDANHKINIFEILFSTDGTELLAALADGKAWAERQIIRGEEGKRARVKLTADADWLLVQLQAKNTAAAGSIAHQHTVQEILQEHEVTHRKRLP